MQELVNRFAEAYVNMAEQANYRPAAPGDGCGGISLSDEERRDPQQLKREASEYALRFMEEAEQHRFITGCSNFTTNRALVYVIETATFRL